MTLSTWAATPTASSRQRSSTAGPTEILIIVCAGVVLASLDLFIVNVALPSIARDLHASNLAELSWVLNGYAIAYAALLVFLGRLADRYRRDGAFLLGVAVFTAASAACALSTSVGMLVGFRVAQAAGAALLTPTSLGLVLASHGPEQRQAAVRTWTAVGALAAAIGPVVGGLLVVASWRWVFLVNVPVGLVALVVGARRLPAVPGHVSNRPEANGVLLVTFGVALLVYGLVKAPAWGWASSRSVAALSGGFVLLVAFARHCLRSQSPLVHPDLFRTPHFRGASAIALFFSASFGAMLLSIVLWEQGAWGWSALRAGLAIAPGPLAVPVISFLVAGRMTKRYGPGLVMSLGAAAFGSGMMWWALSLRVHPDYLSAGLAGMILTGIGVGLTLPTMMATGAGSLPPTAFATGSAVINMIRQTGLALGVAVLVAVLGPGAARPAAHLDAFQRGWWVAAGVSFATVPLALLLLRRPRPPAIAGPPSSLMGIVPIGQQPTTAARPRRLEGPDGTGRGPQPAESLFLTASGLTVEEISSKRVTGSLVVGAAHHTPFGIVHGGVYATAVESAASVGASYAVADAGLVAVGLTNTTHFLRALSAGTIRVDARALYQGRTHQLWEVTLTDSDGRATAHGEVRLQNVPAPPPVTAGRSPE